MKTIYFDMDGVLADFETMYIDTFNDAEFKFVGKNWDKLTRSKFFERLSPIKEGIDLLNFCIELDNINVEILSTTSTLNAENVIMRKSNWLTNNSISIKSNFVAKNHEKGLFFANKNSLLIDDRDICIDPFIKHNGNAIKFKHDNITEIKGKILKWI